MHYKVEPSGCGERKGMVQVRYSFYLDPTDYGYNKHHIQVPVIPKEGHPSKMDERGNPLDMIDYQKWIDGLPKVWQDNPFHNHMYYFEPDVTEEQIKTVGQTICKVAKAEWDKDKMPRLVNVGIKFPTTVLSARKDVCVAKAESIKSTVISEPVSTEAKT
jgi:hypothetical protein